MAVKNRLPYPSKNADGTDGKMPEALKSVDIRDTLNAHGGKVTNKTSSFFKTDANINKWSKHKPIVTGHVAGNFDKTMFVPYYSELWDKQAGSAPTKYIGLGVGSSDDWGEIWNGCSEDEWFQYRLPKGGADEPFRKGDFRGYRADATSPFKEFRMGNDSLDPVSGNISFELYMRYYLVNDDDEIEGGMLSLSDMAVFKDEEVYTMVLIDKYKGSYTPYEGSSVSTANWGLLTSDISLGKINSTNEGTHEFAVALKDTTGVYYKLPFKPIKVEAEIFYVRTTVISKRGEVTATYHYDGNTGKKIYDSITVTLWATFVRGSEDNAETEILADFGIGTENYNDAGFNMPDVRFTIPDSGTGSQPKKEVKSTKTFTSADGTNFTNLSTYYDAQTLVGYIGSEVIQLTY